MNTARPKPGSFHATCRSPREEYVAREDVPTAVLAAWGGLSVPGLADEERYELERTVSDWGRPHAKSAGQYIHIVRCELNTTDRVEFETHMADVHGRTPAKWGSSRPTESGRLALRTLKKSQPTKRPDGGKPFKASTKAIDETVKTCPGCGLIAEVSPTNAANLWWDEHLRGCALIDRAAS